MKLLNVLCFAFVLNFAAPLWADPAEELNALLGKVNSLSGLFQQVITDEEGTVVEENSGKFSLQRPGLFRWEIELEFPQLIVTDKNTLWVYDPDLEQVTVQPYASNQQQAPALLLSGDLDTIRDNFSVSTVADELGPTFVLSPLKDVEVFTKMEVTFKEGVFASMTLNDTLAQTTVITFTDVEVNPDFPADHFRFEPPEGVDVLVND